MKLTTTKLNNNGGLCHQCPISVTPCWWPPIHQQTVSGVNQPSTPRTPGTPSDGSHTPNPPTPNSGSVVSPSPQQFVAITVEAGSSETAANGVSNTTNSYVSYVEGTPTTEHSAALYSPPATTVAANGQSISYSVYSSVEDDTSGVVTYSPANNNTSNYYQSGSSTTNGLPYSQEDSSYFVQSPASSNNSMSALLDGGGLVVSDLSESTSSMQTNRVPEVTRKKKNVPELNPLPGNQPSSQRRSVSHPQRQEDYSSHEEGENIYLDDVNNTSYASSGAGNELGSELDPFTRYVVHGANSADIDNFLDQNTEAGLMYPNSVSSAPSIRTNPLTVQWLLENYENAEGVSLPRYTLYNHYLRHCTENTLDPVNAASFGKLIRGVFLGLRTRRLGTRGNSKYHYYGIRLKPESPLNLVKDEYFPMNGGFPTNGHHNSSGNAHKGGGGAGLGGGMPVKKFKPAPRNDLGDNSNGFVNSEASEFMPYLGDASGMLEEFPELDAGGETYPAGIAENDLFVFRTLYREHCKTLLDVVSQFQISQMELNWKLFWRGGDDFGAIPAEDTLDFDKILPKSKMLLVCKMKAVEEFVRNVDYKVYQHVLEILLPDVLRPIPSGMTQAIRNFAKILESSVASTMQGYPEPVVDVRVTTVGSLAQTLRRYTSLNHLAQAARAVLQNQNQITQMLADLNRVDFRNIEEQASWVCGCEGDVVPNLESEFKATLQQQQNLDQWAAWLEKVVDKLVKPHENSPNFINTARMFLLKWSFYSSLIIRDLTLRSAASFGSFHLLRLLYDEYIFYIVEHRVARATGVVPIQVIGNKKKSPSGLFSGTFEVSSSVAISDKAGKQTNGGAIPSSPPQQDSPASVASQQKQSTAVAVKTEAN